MLESIETDNLTVEAMAGSADQDPNGQGFSGTFASFVSLNPILIAKAKMSRPLTMQLTVKCGILEVDGRVSKTELVGNGVEFILSVDAIRFSHPKREKTDLRARAAELTKKTP